MLAFAKRASGFPIRESLTTRKKGNRMATLEKKQDLSDSHWYSRDGVPAYTMLKKDGGERSTTLRDARKHGLLPSVTTIFAIMAKPGLDKWKLSKAVEAAMLVDRDQGEPQDRYIDRVIERSREEVTQAANLGTRIHDAIDAAFDGVEPEQELKPYVEPTMAYLSALGLSDIQREDVVVNAAHGYAGRVDLLARFGNSNIVIDFKTRKTTEGQKVTPYEFQAMQIAAYGMAAFGSLEFTHGANVYISTTEPGRIETSAYKPEMLQSEYEAFKSMCAIWRYLKNYDPRS